MALAKGLSLKAMEEKAKEKDTAESAPSLVAGTPEAPIPVVSLSAGQGAQQDASAAAAMSHAHLTATMANDTDLKYLVVALKNVSDIAHVCTVSFPDGSGREGLDQKADTPGPSDVVKDREKLRQEAKVKGHERLEPFTAKRRKRRQEKQLEECITKGIGDASTRMMPSMENVFGPVQYLKDGLTEGEEQARLERQRTAIDIEGSQNLNEKAAFEKERVAFAKERAAFEKERAAFEKERAEFEKDKVSNKEAMEMRLLEQKIGYEVVNRRERVRDAIECEMQRDFPNDRYLAVLNAELLEFQGPTSSQKHG